MDGACRRFGPLVDEINRPFTYRGAHMIRSLIRTTLLSAAFVLAASVAHAGPSSPAEVEGNKMEKKGNAEEKAANADKAKGAKMEKSGNKAEKAGVDARKDSAKAKSDAKK